MFKRFSTVPLRTDTSLLIADKYMRELSLVIADNYRKELSNLYLTKNVRKETKKLLLNNKKRN